MLSFENPIAIIVLFMSMAMVPFAMLGLTSFVKLSVVFGLLRNALGAQQVPSAAITTLLSLALTIHIMMPVGELVYSSVQPIVVKQLESKSSDPLVLITESFSVAKTPMTDFLTRFSSEKARIFFASAAATPNQSGQSEACVEGKCLIVGESILSLVPAFVVTELQQAFTIGVLIFLPFLIVDLVVANILVGMGMMMVSPVTIAMPLKILLFVLCDGWLLLAQSLVMSYR